VPVAAPPEKVILGVPVIEASVFVLPFAAWIVPAVNVTEVPLANVGISPEFTPSIQV